MGLGALMEKGRKREEKLGLRGFWEGLERGGLSWDWGI